MFLLDSAECHQNYAPAVPGSHRAGPCGPGGAPHGRRECGRPRRARGRNPRGGKGVKARTAFSVGPLARADGVCIEQHSQASKPGRRLSGLSIAIGLTSRHGTPAATAVHRGLQTTPRRWIGFKTCEHRQCLPTAWSYVTKLHRRTPRNARSVCHRVNDLALVVTLPRVQQADT